MLIDTCADEAHHAHGSGEKNCRRCLKGTQLQIIAVCAVKSDTRRQSGLVVELNF